MTNSNSSIFFVSVCKALQTQKKWILFVGYLENGWSYCLETLPGDRSWPNLELPNFWSPPTTRDVIWKPFCEMLFVDVSQSCIIDFPSNLPPTIITPNGNFSDYAQTRALLDGRVSARLKIQKSKNARKLKPSIFPYVSDNFKRFWNFRACASERAYWRA